MQVSRWLIRSTVCFCVAVVLTAPAASGAGWTAQNSGTNRRLSGVWFTDLNNGWVVGRGAMMRTTDGGATWTNQKFIDKLRGEVDASRFILQGIQFVNRQVGWVVGAGEEGGLVLTTRNGGRSWAIISAPNDRGIKGWLQAVHFVDPMNGWAVGIYGVIMSSKDGGLTWTQQANRVTGQSLSSVHFVDAMKGWAVGQTTASGQMSGIGGQLLQTVDGGANWRIVANPGPGSGGSYGQVFFANPDLGWITSSAGRIVRTTDGGKTWTVVKTAGRSGVSAIRFLDANLGWAVGWNREVQCSKDGGATWTMQVGTGQSYSGIYFVDAKNGWLVGDDGVILHTTTGGE